MRVCVIGTGYVGLVTGACLSEVGHHVLCMDNDEARTDKLKSGAIPLHEPDLEDLILENTKNGNLAFTNSIQEAIAYSELIFTESVEEDRDLHPAFFEPLADGSSAIVRKRPVRSRITDCIGV